MSDEYESTRPTQRPGTIVGAVVIGVVLAAVQFVGIYQLITYLDELGNSSPTRVYIAFTVSAIVVGLLLWGVVLAWRGRSTKVLVTGVSVVFVLSIVDFFTTQFTSFISLGFAALAYLAMWLARREESQRFVVYSES